MFDFSKIEGFDWDQGNARKSSEKHSASQREAEEVFADKRVLISNDDRHSESEARHHALGMTLASRLLLVAFTLRQGGTRLRIISARTASRKERAIYEEEA